MKAKNIISFALVMILIVCMAAAVFGDVRIGKFRIPAIDDEKYGVKQGLELVGGSYIVFEPDVEDVSKVSAEQIDAAEGIIRARLDSIGQSEATIAQQGGYSLRVELPNVDDSNEAVALIGQTAALQFMNANGEVVMEGDSEHVQKAMATFGQVDDYGNQGYYVQLTLTDKGREKFKEATQNAVALSGSGMNFIAICMDGVPYSMPSVKEVIDSDTCVITGDFTQEDAEDLANVINSGRLPFSLTVAEQQTIGATLGKEAFDSSMLAAIVGIILVMLFMLIVYRLPGLVADVSLIAYVAIVCLIMTGFYRNIPYVTTLTLPGIAGVILSIGMAVDANVVIFERIKDELNAGKSVGASVDSGFKRALTAVIDSNVTTLITCVVLYIFGTGTIKSFAETLFIGVVVSLLTAVFLTKFLLKNMVGFGIKNPWVYGASKRRDA